MLVRQVALVKDSDRLQFSEIAKVSAALQKQAVRDFGPIWGVQATVDGFEKLEDVPIGYWPILVGDEGQGGGGVHLDRNHQPYALVDLTDQWTVTASHECLEMLADPFGNRLVAGDSVDPSRPGRMEYLVEVCDPCEAPELGYTVNGIQVSDFYTPRYFDPPQQGGPQLQYDFQGHLNSSREVLKGGYLSWREPATNEWFQKVFFDDEPEFRSLGKMDASFASIRVWIDSLAHVDREKVMNTPPQGRNQLLQRMTRHGRDEDPILLATRGRAETLRDDISIVRGKKP